VLAEGEELGANLLPETPRTGSHPAVDGAYRAVSTWIPPG